MPNGGASLGQYAGNLQVLWGLLTVFGAVCWQPTGLVGVVIERRECRGGDVGSVGGVQFKHGGR